MWPFRPRRKLMAILDELTAAVNANTDAVNGAVAQLASMSAPNPNVVDPAAVAALTATLQNAIDTLNAGVAAAKTPPA